MVNSDGKDVGPKSKEPNSILKIPPPFSQRSQVDATVRNGELEVSRVLTT
jgi:hypothetical protein